MSMSMRKVFMDELLKLRVFILSRKRKCFFFRILQYRDKFNRHSIFYVILNLRMGSFL